MPFQKGHKKVGGRKANSVNKIPKLVKDCVILAAELEGMNQNGKDGMVGFLRRLAREDIAAFASMLKGSMGMQHESRDMKVVDDVVYETVEEVRRELASRGITIETLTRIMYDKPKMVDGIELIDGDVVDAEVTGATNGSGSA